MRTGAKKKYVASDCNQARECAEVHPLFCSIYEEIKMTKVEFLNRLKEALENGLDSRTVQENMNYYRSYIEDEVAKGQNEEKVIEDLGDPWVIAQSVISMEESRSVSEGPYKRDGAFDGYGDSDNLNSQGRPDVRIYTHGVSGFRMLLFVLGVIGIFLIVFAVIGGLISLVMPVVLPVLVVILLVRFFRRMR